VLHTIGMALLPSPRMRFEDCGACCPLAWPQLKRLLEPPWLAYVTAYTPALLQDARHWYGTTMPIPRAAWLSIETWRSPRWRLLPWSEWGRDPASGPCSGASVPPERS
jgi:hypothetical protein